DATGSLSPAAAMELWLGPNPAVGSYFDSREALEQAWKTHRNEIMAQWGSHGRRPAAYYEFEWDGDRPSYDRERSVLWRAGVLSAMERIELETQWKQDFAQGRDPKWSDIPRELLRRWKAERRRKK